MYSIILVLLEYSRFSAEAAILCPYHNQPPGVPTYENLIALHPQYPGQHCQDVKSPHNC